MFTKICVPLNRHKTVSLFLTHYKGQAFAVECRKEKTMDNKNSINVDVCAIGKKEFEKFIANKKSHLQKIKELADQLSKEIDSFCKTDNQKVKKLLDLKIEDKKVNMKLKYKNHK